MQQRDKPATRMNRKQRRAQLIEVALDVFATHGFAQTTMDNIADQASVSKPVLYQHFANKRDLYFTIIDLQLNDLHQAITSRMQSVDPAAKDAGEQRVYQAVYGVFAFTSDPRGLYRLILDTSMDNPEEITTRKDQFLDEMVEFISPYLLNNSVLDPASSQFITGGIASTVIELACRWAEDHNAKTSSSKSIPLELAVSTTYRFVAHGALGFVLANNPTA